MPTQQAGQDDGSGPNATRLSATRPTAVQRWWRAAQGRKPEALLLRAITTTQPSRHRDVAYGFLGGAVATAAAASLGGVAPLPGAVCPGFHPHRGAQPGLLRIDDWIGRQNR